MHGRKNIKLQKTQITKVVVSNWAKDHDKCEIYITADEFLECATSDLVIYLVS